MTELSAFAFLVFTSFFALMNPLGTMSIFMTLTGNLTPEARKRTATKATLVALITLFFFAIGGQLLFDFFNISVDGLRIVGGVIFFVMGFDMLQARLARVKVAEDEIHTYVEDISVTPLAIPMICGPGAITNAIVLMEDAKTVEFQLVLFGIMILVMFITWMVLQSANKLLDVIGDTGNKVLMRLMGLILMVMAVEFIVAGATPIVLDIARSIKAL